MLFAGLTLTLALGIANLVAEWAERRVKPRTDRPDDAVLFVSEPLFERAGEWIQTTEYARESMLPLRFRAVKGRAFRLFLLGESFAMGTPYSTQSAGAERPGGMSSWLRADLTAALAGRPVEVLVAAAGAQTSHRVRRIAEEVLAFEPDAILVVTGNNEGAPNPSYVREQLHRLGGYRLLTSLIAPPPPDEKRPLFSPQQMPDETVRSTFGGNVAAILSEARARGVTVILATMPIHLRYAGSGAPLPPDQAPSATPTDPCVRDAATRLDAGEAMEALSDLERCADPADAARWIGLSLLALGRREDAVRALELSVELFPRNRCRPSLNGVLRELATAHVGVVLADLDARSRRIAPDGVPGSEQFVDYCHMNWWGYAEMADEVFLEMVRSGIVPAPTPRPSRDSIRRSLQIPDDPNWVPP